MHEVSYKRTFVLAGLAVLLVIITVVIWSTVLHSNKNILSISFLDVGQGDAIFVETPNGNQLLIDAGRDSSVLRELGKVMSFRDRSIDMVLATHADLDHIGGMPDIFARYEIEVFSDSGNKGTNNIYKVLSQVVEDEEVAHIELRSGQRILLDEDVYLDVLFPDRDVSGIETNASSVIVRLVFDDISLLLSGDAPTSIEKYVVSRYGHVLESNILKLGHHGSHTSSAPAFLGFVDPEIAVVSAGCDNQYGHPHEAVLERVSRFGIDIYSTCKEGTITFESNGSSITVIEG